MTGNPYPSRFDERQFSAVPPKTFVARFMAVTGVNPQGLFVWEWDRTSAFGHPVPRSARASELLARFNAAR